MLHSFMGYYNNGPFEIRKATSEGAIRPGEAVERRGLTYFPAVIAATETALPHFLASFPLVDFKR